MQPLKNGLTISILAYKEEENLRVLIPEIKELLTHIDTDYEIVIVDTAVPLDNTESVCKLYDCRYVNQRYPKFGGAFRTAIEEAGYNKFLIMDGDGSHPVKYIKPIYDKFIKSNANVVIGSRYVKGGITNDSKISIMMSWMLNTAFRIALGIRAHDISTDYRMYYTDELKRIRLQNENYDVLQEVLLKIKLNNSNHIKIEEIPITFEKRKYGQSKRRLIPFIISYIKSLFRLSFLRFKKQ